MILLLFSSHRVEVMVLLWTFGFKFSFPFIRHFYFQVNVRNASKIISGWVSRWLKKQCLKIIPGPPSIPVIGGDPSSLWMGFWGMGIFGSAGLVVPGFLPRPMFADRNGGLKSIAHNFTHESPTWYQCQTQSPMSLATTTKKGHGKMIPMIPHNNNNLLFWVSSRLSLTSDEGLSSFLRNLW